MKTRNGFVSNSSSSSFIIATNKTEEKLTKKDIIKILKNSKINFDSFYDLLADEILYNASKNDLKSKEYEENYKYFFEENKELKKYKHVYDFSIEGGGDGGTQISNFIRDNIKVDYENKGIKAKHTGSF